MLLESSFLFARIFYGLGDLLSAYLQEMPAPHNPNSNFLQNIQRNRPCSLSIGSKRHVLNQELEPQITPK